MPNSRIPISLWPTYTMSCSGVAYLPCLQVSTTGWPKITGRMLSDTLGKLHFWLTFIGFNVAFFPMHFLGMDGMPRRVYTYQSAFGWDFWNLVSTVGAFLLGASMHGFSLHNAFRSLRKGEPAGNDPWDGRTLEWSIASPPPVYNFVSIPTVHSRDAFWDQKYGNGEYGAPVPVAGGAETGHTSEGEDHGADAAAAMAKATGMNITGSTCRGFPITPWLRPSA